MTIAGSAGSAVVKRSRQAEGKIFLEVTNFGNSWKKALRSYVSG